MSEKISGMAVASALTGAELMEVVQGGVNKQTTTQDIADLGGGGSITSVNGDTGPVVVLDATDVGADPAGSASTVNTALGNHISDATDAHAGTAITNTPAGNIAATTVQAAINELDSEKQASLGFTPENSANKATSVVPSATQYPNNDAVIAYVSASNVDLVYTAAGTNTYTATPSGITALTAGITTTIYFPNANSALYPTINVNGLGDRLIKKQISVDLSIGDIGAGSVYTLYYNGTYWQILNDVSVRKFYNVERYGARHDEKTVSDANVSSGSPTLTSATAAFVSNDTGKSIRVTGAGAAGADLITTITFVNSTTVTLGTNASTTISAKQIYWGTDNAGPIQSCLNACHADGGGTVYFPDGVYGVYAALITLVDGVNPNAQIYIPKSYTSTATFRTIHLLGESVPNPLLSGLGNTGVTKVMSGVVIHSHILGSGTLPSVFGSSFENVTIGYNFTGVVYENISVQVRTMTGTTHVAPTMNAFSLRYHTWGITPNCAAFTESDPFQDSVSPSTTCYGFYYPQTSEAQAFAAMWGQTTAIGYNTGFRISEHNVGGRFFSVCCARGAEFTGSGVVNHPNYGTFTAHWCNYDLVFTGPVEVNIDYYTERYGAGKWYQHTNDILFVSTPQVEGMINANIMIAGGTHGTPNSSGAFTGHLKVSDLYTNTDYYFNSATYTYEAVGGAGIAQSITRNQSYQNTLTNLSTGTLATASYQVLNSSKLTQWGMTGSGYTGSAYLGASGSFQYTDSPIGHSFWLADTGTPVFKIGFGATPTEVFRLTSAGRLFLGGSTTPTARLHIAAGTATASTAPLKFTAGTNLTTPEAGAVEFDGTNYFATSSSTRYTLAKTLTATATLNFDLTAVNYQDLTITVTGAADGDAVVIGVPNGAAVADITFFGWVSAANTVTIRVSRVGGGGAADPASGTFRASVLKY